MSAQAHWADEDVDTLTDFLFSKRMTSADSGATFKDNIWTEAAEIVNKVPPKIPLKKGGPKTKGSCKSKWGKVKPNYT